MVLYLKWFLCVRNRENQENYATPAVDSLNYQSPVTIKPTQDKPLAQLAYGSFAEHDFCILNNFLNGANRSLWFFQNQRF